MKTILTGLAVGLMAALLIGHVRAAERLPPITPQQCEAIRSFVGMFGEKAAERMAREQRWSEERIAQARQCLTLR